MRQAGETFKRFMQCIAWAKEGKTFIYVHPDFVAIDMKSWKKIQTRHEIPKSAHIDEMGTWTPKMAAELDEILKRK